VALHRKYREGNLTINAFRIVLREFAHEIEASAVRWLPFSQAVLDRIQGDFEMLPRTKFLRASDAIHVVTAAENGFREIYSNDTNPLAAAFWPSRGKRNSLIVTPADARPCRLSSAVRLSRAYKSASWKG